MLALWFPVSCSHVDITYISALVFEVNVILIAVPSFESLVPFWISAIFFEQSGKCVNFLFASSTWIIGDTSSNECIKRISICLFDLQFAGRNV